MNDYLINLKDPPIQWYKILEAADNSADYVVFSENEDDMIWFVTNFIQNKIIKGGSELIVLHGEYIDSWSSFAGQLNYLIPVGYRVKGENVHAVYDMLLGLETHPAKRLIVLNRAEILYCNHRDLFLEIFDLLVTVAYGTRQGSIAMQDDGKPYVADFKNMFLFSGIKPSEIEFLLKQERDISFFDPDKASCVFNYNCILLKG